MDPKRIESESFRRIEALVPREERERLSFGEWEVIRRVIHTTGDVGFLRLMRFSKGAVEQGVSALLEGLSVLTDTRMLLSGISTGRLDTLGVPAFCFIGDEGTRRLSLERGITRSSAAMEVAIERIKGLGIVAIGNAPTALFHLLHLVAKKKKDLRLVIGTPVGFVSAIESKETLMASKIPYITCLGTRGGSPVAAAIINALSVMALKEMGQKA